jgi:hypothetical protein
MNQAKTYKVKHVKTGEVREVGESVAKDAQSLAAQGYELVSNEAIAQQPKPEKKSVKPVVAGNEEFNLPVKETMQFTEGVISDVYLTETTDDDAELPTEIKAKRKYTKRK